VTEMTMTRVVRFLLLAAMALSVESAQPSAQATASLSGRVVSDDAAATPVARAIVTVYGAALVQNRSAVTDERGEFTIAGLPPGRFTVTASKASFLTTGYGAKRPGRPGTPMTVAASEQLSGIVLRLARTAVISGSVRDEKGAPVQGAVVSAGRIAAAGDTPEEATTAVSDDHGAYRVVGLAPGEYFVAATGPIAAGLYSSSQGIGVRSAEEVDAILSALARGQRRDFAGTRSSAAAPSRPGYTYAAVFYPGTPFPEDAARLTLATGDELRGIDLVTRLVRTSRIEGIALSSDGTPLSSALIRLSRGAEGLPRLIGWFSFGSSAETSADGRFSLLRVEPGQYTLTARKTAFVPVQDEFTGDWKVLYAQEEIRANGEDRKDIVLRLQQGTRLAGRITIDTAAPEPSMDLATLRVSLVPLKAGTMLRSNIVTGNSPFASSVTSNGTFEIDSIAPGWYRLASTAPVTDGWWLRSAMVKGVDVLDVPLELGKSGDISGAVLTFSNRHTELSGMLQGPKGAPAPEYFVIAFPADRALWRAGSRRVQVTRPATDGTFAIQNLPGGEYLLAALTDVEPNDWNDAAFLQQLVAGAVKLTLADGEKKIQNLRLGGAFAALAPGATSPSPARAAHRPSATRR